MQSLACVDPEPMGRLKTCCASRLWRCSVLGNLDETQCPLRFLRAVRLALDPLATVF
jgi:hypothetical protein